MNDSDMIEDTSTGAKALLISRLNAGLKAGSSTISRVNVGLKAGSSTRTVKLTPA